MPYVQTILLIQQIIHLDLYKYDVTIQVHNLACMRGTGAHVYYNLTDVYSTDHSNG